MAVVGLGGSPGNEMQNSKLEFWNMAKVFHGGKTVTSLINAVWMQLILQFRMPKCLLNFKFCSLPCRLKYCQYKIELPVALICFHDKPKQLTEISGPFIFFYSTLDQNFLNIVGP
jgi:hypothetical protein